MALKIRKGVIKRPIRLVIYGQEGVGKTTYAADAPGALFIDTENGSDNKDVRRIEKPETWEELLDIIREVAATPGICVTLVLDTADWAEILCVKHILKKYGMENIEAFGYGKGYVILAEEFANLLAALDMVIASGKNVIVTAHARLRKIEQPEEQGAYDHWELKLTKQCAPLLKEWADALLFANFKTYVVTAENKTKKAQGGKRVIYTTHSPSWDAKNRHNLPDELPLDFSKIRHLFLTEDSGGAETKSAGTKPPPEEEKPIDTLRSMMERDGVTESEVQTVVVAKGHYPADAPLDSYRENFITGWIIKYWTQILDLIRANRAVQE